MRTERVFIVLRSVFLLICIVVFFPPSALSQSFCGRAKTYISELPFICTSRQDLSEGLLADGYEFQRSIGAKDVYFAPQAYILPATLVSLFNEKNELLMAQYIFPVNTSDNAYKHIRQAIDEKFGAFKRNRGSELESRFEFVWFMQDGVRIRFQRKKGAREARLTFNLPHKTKAFLRVQEANASGL